MAGHTQSSFRGLNVLIPFLEGIERLHEQRHPIPRAGEPTRPQDEGGPANLERELSQH